MNRKLPDRVRLPFGRRENEWSASCSLCLKPTPHNRWSIRFANLNYEINADNRILIHTFTAVISWNLFDAEDILSNLEQAVKFTKDSDSFYDGLFGISVSVPKEKQHTLQTLHVTIIELISLHSILMISYSVRNPTNNLLRCQGAWINHLPV